MADLSSIVPNLVPKKISWITIENKGEAQFMVSSKKRNYFSFIFFSFLICSVAQAESKSGALFEPYGFIKFGYNASTRSLDSFGNNNLSAPTAAHPDLTASDSDFQSSFQAAQSRIGTWIRMQEHVKGQLEFDFIDFKLASPTTGSKPRLRIAKISYSPSENQEFIFGQDWDIFSPNKPYSFNIVGLYFQAGNLGFMRQQVQWKMTSDSSLFAVALGLPGKNETATDADLERSKYPLFSSSYTFKFSPHFDAGVSGTIGKLDIGPNLTGVYGINPHFSLKLPGTIDFKAEGYFGQNLGNAGFLPLSIASTSEIIHEAGGYGSFKSPLSSKINLLGGIGFANVTDAVGAPTPFASNLRVKNNIRTSIGISYEIEKGFLFYNENSLFRTTYLAHNSLDSLIAIGSHFELGAYLEF